jgi:dihydroorotate dehydrogenase (NAD+) catalytic subunit
LTPNTADIVGIALAVAEAGADGIVLINTLKGMAIDIKTRRPVLGNITGGLSGPAIKPVALRMVYEVAGALSEIPIIGSGGITSARDALEFFMAGASAVQIGTANLIDPRAPIAILDGICDFMEKEHISNISELIGVARKPTRNANL